MMITFSTCAKYIFYNFKKNIEIYNTYVLYLIFLFKKIIMNFKINNYAKMSVVIFDEILDISLQELD